MEKICHGTTPCWWRVRLSYKRGVGWRGVIAVTARRRLTSRESDATDNFQAIIGRARGARTHTHALSHSWESPGLFYPARFVSACGSKGHIAVCCADGDAHLSLSLCCISGDKRARTPARQVERARARKEKDSLSLSRLSFKKKKFFYFGFDKKNILWQNLLNLNKIIACARGWQKNAHVWYCDTPEQKARARSQPGNVPTY